MEDLSFYGKSVAFSVAELNQMIQQYYDMKLLNHILYGFTECWCGHTPACHFDDMPIKPEKIYPCKVTGCECQCVAIDNLTYIEIMAKEKGLV
jgi:hypothetical protein